MRLRVRYVAVVLAALVTAACGGGAGAASASPSSGASMTPATIKVALPVRQMAFAQADLAVARAQGFFAQQKLTVTTEGLNSGVQSVRAALGGDADIGASSIEPVMTAGQKGGITIIGSYADRLPVVLETPKSITSPKGLEGRKLGVQDVGAFREVMTRAVYESAGLKQSDVQYVPTPDTSYISALVGGQIDSAVLQWEQSVQAEQQDKNLHVLTDLYKLWPQYYYGTYFVKSDWLSAHRDVAVRFLTALVKAHRFIYSNRSKSVSEIATATKFPPSVIDKAYQRMIVQDGVFAVNTGLEQKRLQFTMTKMRQLGLLKGPNPNLGTLVDRGPITTAVQKAGGTMKGDPRWR